MKPTDELEIIRAKYEQAKKLAEEVWIDGDYEGNDNEFYYFQCGFAAGINYENTKCSKLEKGRHSISNKS